MQHWTTSKPNRPGYWWARYDYWDRSDVEVIQVAIIDEELYGCDMYLPLTDLAYEDMLWGSSPLCEPVGEKF